ncbi:two component transcriptional regulator, winged helix family [Emticicia oligotrophica DSM 17448]|uniref:Two component transcriptional regulator, winged helix family n=1 Tax=Emticicia oligotrophica (strain DSM 17448 / CIP 109782 / MTCC 6937 / GPTSA100-15) TaxID=929562 RepID=A0ABN4AQW7_EMTOG|nr:MULTISPECIES: response regulator transcription factor [Emticicia]AFK04784.1 two component transcriptional regulator, winged helix family [Emticicia oligotrophica DSM 17448]
MAATKILLVEDELRLAEYVKKGLEENGFSVDVAYDGQIGRSLALSNAYDLMVFDVNLPKISGLELTKKLRSEQIKTPIMILTAMGTTQDKISGFDSGADDYLVKPFDFLELIARLNALYRRSSEVAEMKKNLQVADLELDLNEKNARRGGKLITLTSKEYMLLEFFMRNNGKVVSRTEIAEKVWNLNFDTGTNTIDVYVNFLRKKIDQNYEVKLIHTVVGRGYMMKG